MKKNLFSLLTAMCFWCILLPTVYAEKITVEVLDVGQGDAILIKSENKTYLVDTGDVSQREKLFLALRRHNVSHINALILTHPHADHIGNAAALINSLLFQVDTVIDNGVVTSSRLFSDYVKACKKKNVSRETNLTICPIGTNAYLYFFPQFVLGNLNNSSIVIKLVNGETSMLLTGDIEQEAEDFLLQQNIRADVLKVAHHGSKTSSTSAFLDAVNPKFAIISYGLDNKYHHPHKVVLQRLLARNIKIYDTVNGDITVELNEFSVSVKHHLSPHSH